MSNKQNIRHLKARKFKEKLLYQKRLKTFREDWEEIVYGKKNPLGKRGVDDNQLTEFKRFFLGV